MKMPRLPDEKHRMQTRMSMILLIIILLTLAIILIVRDPIGAMINGGMAVFGALSVWLWFRVIPRAWNALADWVNK